MHGVTRCHVSVGEQRSGYPCNHVKSGYTRFSCSCLKCTGKANMAVDVNSFMKKQNVQIFKHKQNLSSLFIDMYTIF